MGLGTLVSPLVNGFSDAPSGTAEFYAHGTDTPIVAYSDPDCEMPIGSSVTLNALGRKTCFVKEAADVVVRKALASGAAEVADFPVIVRDTAVTVASDSFTGTLPSGSLGGGGVVSLNEVAALLKQSTNARDFLIRREGSAVDETFVQAFAAVRSTNSQVFNVKDAAYGAIGNGVADDYGAILLAYNAAVAAGGGRLYFPPGTYLCNNSLSFLSNKVSLFGEGAQASVLKYGLTSGDFITFNASAASAFAGAFVANLGLTCATTSSGKGIYVTATPGMLLSQLDITGFHSPVYLSSRAKVEFCNITQGAAPASVFGGIVAEGSAGGTVITDTRYVAATTAAVAAHGIWLQAPNVKVDRCEIDMSGNTNATVTPSCVNIDDAAAIGCAVTNSRLTSPGNATATDIRITVDVDFHESNNGPSPIKLVYTGSAASTKRKWHDSRCEQFVNGGSFAGGGTYTPDLIYERHFITCTGATVTIANPSAAAGNVLPMHGMRVLLVVANASGGNLALTFGTQYHTAAAAGALGSGQKRVYSFYFDAAVADFVPQSHIDSAP